MTYRVLFSLLILGGGFILGWLMSNLMEKNSPPADSAIADTDIKLEIGEKPTEEQVKALQSKIDVGDVLYVKRHTLIHIYLAVDFLYIAQALEVETEGLYPAFFNELKLIDSVAPTYPTSYPFLLMRPLGTAADMIGAKKAVQDQFGEAFMGNEVTLSENEIKILDKCSLMLPGSLNEGQTDE